MESMWHYKEQLKTENSGRNWKELEVIHLETTWRWWHCLLQPFVTSYQLLLTDNVYSPTAACRTLQHQPSLLLHPRSPSIWRYPENPEYPVLYDHKNLLNTVTMPTNKMITVRLLLDVHSAIESRPSNTSSPNGDKYFTRYSFKALPSVLWRCWLGGRKGIRPLKNWVVRYWHGYLSGAKCRAMMIVWRITLIVLLHCLTTTTLHPFNGLFPWQPG